MGTLLGSALLGAGKALSGREQLDGTGFALLFRSMAEAAAERGNAGEGEKTLLDVLFPAARAVEGCDSPDIWKRAQAGLTQAKISLENTRALMSSTEKPPYSGKKQSAWPIRARRPPACSSRGSSRHANRPESAYKDRRVKNWIGKKFIRCIGNWPRVKRRIGRNSRKTTAGSELRICTGRRPRVGPGLLYELGFSPSGDNGDISVRDPETGLVYISASPIEIGYKNLGEYHACDMAVVDMEGNRMTTWSRPTIEMPMHLAILRAVRRQRGGAYPRRLVLRLAPSAAKTIPSCLPSNTRTSAPARSSAPDTAKRVPTSWGRKSSARSAKNNAVLMRNHGAVTVGRTLDEAFTNARFLECIAQKALFATLLGGLQTVNPEDVAEEWAK